MIPFGALGAGSIRASDKAEKELLEKRERAAKAAKVFPGQNGFIADLVGPPSSLETKVERSIQRAAETFTDNMGERRQRFDRLPAEVRRKAVDKDQAENLYLQEVVAHVHRSAALNGGFATTIIAADVARAIGVPTAKADELLDQAVSVGFLRRDRKTMNGGVFRSLV